MTPPNQHPLPNTQHHPAATSTSWLDKLIRFCLTNKLVVALVVLFLTAWGIAVAPFDWRIEWLPRAPVPVDAIPDIGENQQIVFTEWMGRSPQDVEDQITYPLTVSLLGIPGVKTVRSHSFFGFSTIYIIFREEVDFDTAQNRILARLSSLSPGTLPHGIRPRLGPYATALGQVFWYTLEGADADGNATGAWDLNELRTIQDWYVRYALLSADGIAEVASVGGFVQEYQIDVDPDAMRAHRVTLEQVFEAVKMSNVDVGARTIEVNRVEYVIRGLGLIRRVSDIENTVVAVNDNVPIYIRNMATVALGPALRRGALDRGGAEAVGGVVVVRYGENPLAAIKSVKKKIEEISPGLPKKAVVNWDAVTPAEVNAFARDRGIQRDEAGVADPKALLDWVRQNSDQKPEWLTVSQVRIVPFYDRSGLIYETLGTLRSALAEEILITIIVVIFMVMHLRSSVLISASLPLAVLMCFIAMKVLRVDANIVALSGIAIAIGTIVDMGIIICENILRHLDAAEPGENALDVIFRATSEVGGAVVTAVATTVVSFLPVFTMTGAEGKLFKPLAFTKTFALIASVVIALTMIPPFAHLLFAGRLRRQWLRHALNVLLVGAGILLAIMLRSLSWAGAIIAAFGIYRLLEGVLPRSVRRWAGFAANGVAILAVATLLTTHWLPLGPEKGWVRNFLFVTVMSLGLLCAFRVFERVYERLLRVFLAHKMAFLSLPALILLFGAYVWLGPGTVFGELPDALQEYKGVKYEALPQRGPAVYARWVLANDWDGRGKEFMPPLDEGSYLLMPTTMPHASIGEALDVLQKQDMAIRAIPEVESVVGKIGRVESPLDPAPISMVETIINYRPKYVTDRHGHRVRFRYDRPAREFIRDENGELIEDPGGRPFRQWRAHINTPDDIWEEIVRAAQIPGTTSAPRLQPIAARIVMLQSGMRAPMGVKVKGPDLASIEKAGFQIERFLKEVPSVQASSVIADRIIGKPYLEIEIDRERCARYGIHVRRVQDVIEVAIGGRRITTTVEGRQRYPVRVRYPRELRDRIDTLGRILVPAPGGTQIPLVELTNLGRPDEVYKAGPMVIKSEDTFLVGYVIFDKKPGFAEVDVVQACQRHLKDKIARGEFDLPAGVSYAFAGSYENQIRAQKKLRVVLPLALFVIFIILYFQFKSVLTTFIVFSGVFVAWSGGFMMMWLYAQPWFLDFRIFGTDMRELFQVHPFNLSVAVWVGFLALFGIASDNGVVVATYLRQSFARRAPGSLDAIRETTVQGAMRRCRPALMTAGTTILALIPVLTSTGRGADVMVPMAIPSFGGMTIALVTLFVVPVLYSWVEEVKFRARERDRA